MRELLWSRRKKDFKVDFFRGSGPGGQHRNKRDTACRITDIETNLSASSQDSKSQSQNRKSAFHKLVDKLVKHYDELTKPSVSDEQASQALKTTRSYHEPENRVTDHLTGQKFSYKETVGRGDMCKLIEARIKYANQRKQ